MITRREFLEISALSAIVLVFPKQIEAKSGEVKSKKAEYNFANFPIEFPISFKESTTNLTGKPVPPNTETLQGFSKKKFITPIGDK